MKRPSPRRGSWHRQRDERGDVVICEPMKTFGLPLRRKPESSKIYILDSGLHKIAVRPPDRPPPSPHPPKGAAKLRRLLIEKKRRSILIGKSGHATEFTEILVDDGEMMIYPKSKTRKK